ncbi:MAG TPA: aldehyde dehydrogenase [Puia sp.]|nr:aldehyde dehydrogenase [Puia sp.]
MNDLVAQQRSFFLANTTRPAAFRIDQLKRLRSALRRHEQELADAIYKDFGKGGFNTFLTEFTGLYNELNVAVRNLRSWAAVQKVRTNLLNFPGRSYIIPEPLGVCLVIGAWNYPVNLCLGPAIAAIAAGNTVILKPSELASQTSAALAKMIRTNFDPGYFAVIEGGVPETTMLLSQPFDKIFFTGSIAVGRIVAQAAATRLTPITLELGGKSPLIVAPDARLKICIRRLVWGKFVNAGQTCIAPDYVVVHKSIEEKFLQGLKAEIDRAQFSLENTNYAQIISDKHLERLIGLIDPERLFLGGSFDRPTRFLQPTVMTNVSINDKVMDEEIFGPILPVLTYDDLDATLAWIRSRPKPLAFYIFTESRATREKVLTQLSFGNAAVNDVLMQFANDELPFGGVGASGMGSYHGEAGFRNFTHYKSVLQRPARFEFPLKYYPYKRWKLPVIRRVIGS